LNEQCESLALLQQQLSNFSKKFAEIDKRIAFANSAEVDVMVAERSKLVAQRLRIVARIRELQAETAIARAKAFTEKIL
jgi:hypothetical protein